MFQYTTPVPVCLIRSIIQRQHLKENLRLKELRVRDWRSWIGSGTEGAIEADCVGLGSDDQTR